jgi:hypothetical protein
MGTKTRKSLHPKIGDVVRYFDLDGGRDDGQVLVGRITFIFGTKGRYIVEVTELEDVKDGYYAEYSSSKRMGKKTERSLQDVSPVLASYVQSEQAYKIPMEQDTGRGRMIPKVRQDTYDLEDYEGPVGSVVDLDVVERDQVKYQQLKSKLLKNAALAGSIGTVIVNVIQGTEDAAIYLAGVVGSLLYLVFLSLKTDTMATQANKGNSRSQQLGSPFANLRFFMPVLVLLGVSLYNQSRGDMNPLAGSDNMFDTVTQEQFAVAVLGFLTYRVPLFVGQIQDAFAELQDNGDNLMPGSAGIALKALQSEISPANVALTGANDDLATVLLVSGPHFAGRSELVNALLEQDERLVTPRWLKRSDDGATFERLERRDEFLALDETRSKGLTKNAIFEAATSKLENSGDYAELKEKQRVVVVDASVDLAKRLQRLSGTRLIGVWVGLQAVSEFEERIEAGIISGAIPIPPEETKESVVRARIKDIINEIEYGLSSGIFEFTILNGDPEQSLKELKQAAAYAFE